jgi:cell division septum initiation protein DivIVA
MAGPARFDPTSPASVAGAMFSTARKGFAPDEVRAALTAVSKELDRLRERERQLEAELALARRQGASPAELDEAALTERVGEETVRVLQTARESASQIKARAEENAARLVSEATDEVAKLRQQADLEAARRRSQAQTEAEAELALAKQQGREMVNEARAYRERVLADLEARTNRARQQLEELAHGRERLLQVFERARLVAIDVSTELSKHPGPSELVNLSNTTGPVPIMVPAEGRHDVGLDDRTVAELAAEPEPEGPELDAEAEPPVAEEAPPESESPPEPHGEPADTNQADTNVVELFPGRGEAGEPGESAAKPDVEGLFARLRHETQPEAEAQPEQPEPATDATDDVEPAEQPEPATDATDDVEPAEQPEPADQPASEAPTEGPFARRNEVVVPLIVAGARKLKRVLADEQNGVLDVLRGRQAVTSLGALLPDVDAHAATYLAAIQDELLAAASAGAAEVGGRDVGSTALDRAAGLVRTSLVGSLRDRLERSVAAGSGDNGDITRGVRNVYREFKTQHIDDQLDDVFRFAYAGGVASAIEPGTPVVWKVDAGQPGCADCEDNSLAGELPAGTEFPTGHAFAPAHPGCRCLTLPA